MSKDISELKAVGVLKALTSYSGTSYFLYRGKAMSFEYDLLERFAEHLEVSIFNYYLFWSLNTQLK